MASKSGGTIKPFHPAADANRALAMLEGVHHWHATKLNRVGKASGVTVQITHAGRRVVACRRLFVEAVNAAFDKLQNRAGKPKLRLTR